MRASHPRYSGYYRGPRGAERAVCTRREDPYGDRKRPLTIGVYRNVPLVVEMNDVFEALEDAVMHICLQEIWRWPLVHAAHSRRLEETAELGDVARNILVESRPVGRRIGVGTETVIDVLSPE